MNKSEERQVISTSLNAQENEAFRTLRRKLMRYDVPILTDSQVLKMAISLSLMFLEHDDSYNNMNGMCFYDEIKPWN